MPPAWNTRMAILDEPKFFKIVKRKLNICVQIKHFTRFFKKLKINKKKTNSGRVIFDRRRASVRRPSWSSKFFLHFCRPNTRALCTQVTLSGLRPLLLSERARNYLGAIVALMNNYVVKNNICSSRNWINIYVTLTCWAWLEITQRDIE